LTSQCISRELIGCGSKQCPRRGQADLSLLPHFHDENIVIEDKRDKLKIDFDEKDQKDSVNEICLDQEDSEPKSFEIKFSLRKMPPQLLIGQLEAF
jgi:hypothetical protein